MNFVLLAALGFGLVGFGLGWSVGFVGRHFLGRAAWVLSALLVLGVFWVPGLFVLDRAQYVLAGSALPTGGPAFWFAVLSVLVLGVALVLAAGAAVQSPFLAPLAPPVMFVVDYGLVLPLAAQVQLQREDLFLDNKPTVWLFVFSGVATFALLGHALGGRWAGQRQRS